MKDTFLIAESVLLDFANEENVSDVMSRKSEFY
jgi:hypothetical protein